MLCFTVFGFAARLVIGVFEIMGVNFCNGLTKLTFLGKRTGAVNYGRTDKRYIVRTSSPAPDYTIPLLLRAFCVGVLFYSHCGTNVADAVKRYQ